MLILFQLIYFLAVIPDVIVRNTEYQCKNTENSRKFICEIPKDSLYLIAID
jgi:hypothetical protein